VTHLIQEKLDVALRMAANGRGPDEL